MGGKLHRIFYRGIRAALVVVVRRQFVGNEHPGKKTALHGAGHVFPIRRRAPIPVDLVLVMPPHSHGMAIHPMLDKSQQVSFTFCIGHC